MSVAIYLCIVLIGFIHRNPFCDWLNPDDTCVSIIRFIWIAMLWVHVNHNKFTIPARGLILDFKLLWLKTVPRLKGQSSSYAVLTERGVRRILVQCGANVHEISLTVYKYTTELTVFNGRIDCFLFPDSSSCSLIKFGDNRRELSVLINYYVGRPGSAPNVSMTYTSIFVHLYALRIWEFFWVLYYFNLRFSSRLAIS